MAEIVLKDIHKYYGIRMSYRHPLEIRRNQGGTYREKWCRKNNTVQILSGKNL